MFGRTLCSRSRSSRWERAAWGTYAALWLICGAHRADAQPFDDGPVEVIPEPRMLVDAPTAGLLPRGTFDVDLRFFGDGGVVGTIGVGITHRLMIGTSYGGIGLMGADDPDWYPRAEVNIKFRLVQETDSFPAVVLGFDSQGYGRFRRHRFVEDIRLRVNRYEVKSKGFYSVLSKSYAAAGGGGFHLGANRSLEDDDGESGITIFVGLDKVLRDEISLVLDYDFQLNDDSRHALGSGDGFLNLGVRWEINRRFTVEVDLKDVVQGTDEGINPRRELRLVYLDTF